MAFASLDFPPGVYRPGTEYAAKGRFYDANLTRWAPLLQPIGGWQTHSAASAMSGAARAIVSWRDNAGNAWIGIGTHSNLYVQSADGTQYTITPSGFVAGRADPSYNLGYGGGFYGQGTYGSPRAAAGPSLPATVWTLDTFGQYLVGCSLDDGNLYEWTLNTSSLAVAITNAPTSCTGLVTTPEKFLFALGAAGVKRRVQWCDQASETSWAVSSTSQAGSKDLETRGSILCGKALHGVTLIFTDVDVWAATYLGYPLVYGFERLDQNCGAISQGCVAILDRQAVWMGKDRFWMFNGANIVPLESDVQDYVFSDINASNNSKVTSGHNSKFGEIWWFYCSAAASENDRYVFWNYRYKYWGMGQLGRLAWADKGVFNYPVATDSGGLLYDHERGFNYGGAVVYAETAPLEIGDGDFLGEVQAIIPDEKTLGDVNVTLKGKYWPSGAETTYGPYALTSQVSVLVQAAQLKVRFTGVNAADWRVGSFRLDIVKGDPHL